MLDINIIKPEVKKIINASITQEQIELLIQSSIHYCTLTTKCDNVYQLYSSLNFSIEFMIPMIDKLKNTETLKYHQLLFQFYTKAGNFIEEFSKKNKKFGSKEVEELGKCRLRGLECKITKFAQNSQENLQLIACWIYSLYKCLDFLYETDVAGKLVVKFLNKCSEIAETLLKDLPNLANGPIEFACQLIKTYHKVL